LIHQKPPFAYLTDGGHFESLGVYELLRRRCKTIYCFNAGPKVKPQLSELYQALDLALRDGFISDYHYVTFDAKADLPYNINIKRMERMTGHGESVLHQTRNRVSLIKVLYNTPRKLPKETPISPKSQAPHEPDTPSAQAPIQPPEGEEIKTGIFSGSVGFLWYTMATMTGNEPGDMQAYTLTTPKFPFHSSTRIIYDQRTYNYYENLGSVSVRDQLRLEEKVQNRML